MFNLRLCNAATIRYSLFKFGHMHLCGKGYMCFSPHCCRWNSFGCIAVIKCGNAYHGPYGDFGYSGSKHRQFNLPPSVKRASPTHGGHWLAQTNYDALMTHDTTETTAFPLTYLHSFVCWVLFGFCHLFSMDSCELYHYVSHGKVWLIYKKMFVAQFTRFISSSL